MRGFTFKEKSGSVLFVLLNLLLPLLLWPGSGGTNQDGEFGLHIKITTD